MIGIHHYLIKLPISEKADEIKASKREFVVWDFRKHCVLNIVIKSKLTFRGRCAFSWQVAWASCACSLPSLAGLQVQRAFFSASTFSARFCVDSRRLIFFAHLWRRGAKVSDGLRHLDCRTDLQGQLVPKQLTVKYIDSH